MPESRQKFGQITDIIWHSDHPSETAIMVSEKTPASLASEAGSDSQVIALWLHGRSRHTQKAYHADVLRFFIFAGEKSLPQITLRDLQAFSDHLSQEGLEKSSCHRILAAVKSLITFAHRIGYLAYDVSEPLRLPKFKDKLAERILSESEVQRIIGMESNERNHLLLRVLYASGIRVSELCNLTWNNLQDRGSEGGQITILGKGEKTNTILIPNPLWNDLMIYRNNAAGKEPVFKSRKKGKLDPGHVDRLVRKAAKRAGIRKSVSPHWFRHAHASHALDHGCPIHIVQRTLNHSSVATTGRYTHARPTESSSKYLTV
jgi:integrase/recombinase XerD